MSALARWSEEHTEDDRPRVLVVEDEPAQRRMAASALEGCGYDVVEAATGEAALKVLYSGQVAVALVDQHLPGPVKGLEILHTCHRDFPLTRLIMVTGSSNVALAVGALRNGAYDFMEKPVQAVLLREKVKRAVENHQLLLGKENLLRRYETLFETIPGVVFFVAHDGVLKRVNREGARLLGYEASQLVGQHYSLLMEHGLDATSDQFVFRERRTGSRAQTRRTIALVSRTGERRVFEFLATGVWAASHASGPTEYVGNIGAGWDITERVKLEEQLRQRHKMEALGRVAGGVAHDFNNIMSVINANVKLMAAELPPDHRLQEVLRDVDAAGQHAADLTRQLLTFARKRPARLQPLELHETIQSLLPLVTRLMGETVRVETNLCEQKVPMHADHGQLEQLVMNLCINARDAMPRGGVVTITTTPVSHGGPQGEPFIRLTVADTGVGMEEEVQQHLFEPFFTTKDADHGTGLGLAVVHGVVLQHRGTVRAESSPGHGTRMHVELPYDPTLVLGPRSTPPASIQAGAQQTILVVEDEAMVRRMLRRVLERQGYQVLEAADGRQALSLLQNVKVAPALIITDMVMPVMGGAELAKRARDLHPGIPVLAVSGYSRFPERQTLEDLGIPLVEKPIAPARILDALETLLPKRETASD